jgi:hypothetical protein
VKTVALAARRGNSGRWAGSQRCAVVAIATVALGRRRLMVLGALCQSLSLAPEARQSRHNESSNGYGPRLAIARGVNEGNRSISSLALLASGFLVGVNS